MVNIKAYSGVPNRSAGTYAEFRLRRERNEKFFTGCSKLKYLKAKL